MERKCLIKKSPNDKRDFDAEKVYKTNFFPEYLDLRVDLNEPRDQGLQGTCAAVVYNERIPRKER